VQLADNCTAPPVAVGNADGVAVAEQPLGAVGLGGVVLVTQVIVPFEISKLSHPTMLSVPAPATDDATNAAPMTAAFTKYFSNDKSMGIPPKGYGAAEWKGRSAIGMRQETDLPEMQARTMQILPQIHAVGIGSPHKGGMHAGIDGGPPCVFCFHLHRFDRGPTEVLQQVDWRARGPLRTKKGRGRSPALPIPREA
jgi:hypothetical protein